VSRLRLRRKVFVPMPLAPNDVRRKEQLIGLLAVLASLAASQLHWQFDPLLNPDGVAYLLAAQAWLDKGLSAAAAIYPSPVYSMLIALTHRSLGLDLLTSAHYLDAAALAALAIAVQSLVRVAGAGTRTQAYAVLWVILLPELNGYRSFVLRDFWYWALATFALSELVRFAIGPSIRAGVLFVATGTLAVLFRMEALAILLLMPLALLLVPCARRYAVLLYVPLFATATIAALRPDAALSNWLTGIAHKCISLAEDVPSRVHAQLQGFAAGVLDPRFHDYVAFGLAGGLATLVLVHVVIAASVPMFVTASVGAIRGSLKGIDRRALPVLLTAIALAVAGVAAVLVARGIVQTRYAMLAAIVIAALAAFVVDAELARATPLRRKYVLIPLLGLGLTYYAVENGYELVNSKQHYLRAATWLASHTAPDARIYSDDLRLVFLAGRRVEWRDVERVSAPEATPVPDDYDFVVLKQRDRIEEVRRPGYERVATFESSKRGEAIEIYRVTPTIPSGRPP
jgi:hypothetical protein